MWEALLTIAQFLYSPEMVTLMVALLRLLG
jgi:hypothetical protein